MNPPPAMASLTGGREPRRETEMHWPGSRLGLVWLLCLTLSLVAVALYFASLPSFFARHYMLCTGTSAGCVNSGLLTPGVERQLLERGLSKDFYVSYTIAVTSLAALGDWVVAALLFWRQPDNRLALLAAVALGTYPLQFDAGYIDTLPAPWWGLAHGLSYLSGVCLALFFFLFPSGHFVPRPLRWLFVALVVYGGFNAFLRTSPLNPFFTFPVLNNLIVIVGLGGPVIAQIYRYRRVSSPAQRRQTRWVVYGAALGAAGYLAIFAVTFFFPATFRTGSLVSLLGFTGVWAFPMLVPVSIGVALVRSHLWDIDLLINRTLVYGVLTVCVVGLYVLVVGSLGALVGAGGNLGIELLATGLVAVLFQPLRAFLQRGVNRLLYGQRDEPYTVITQLSRRLAGTPAPEAVLATIVETVAQALKLPYVAILLKQEAGLVPAANAGQLVGEPLVLPLVHQAETIGQLRLAPRTPGEPFSPADRRLLDELARQTGQAAHAVQLTADLHRAYAHLEQRVAERTRELASLLEVSHNVAATLELKPLLGLILDQLQTVVEYREAAIMIGEDEDLVILDYRGWRPPEQMRGRHLPQGQAGGIWEPLGRKEPVIIDDVGAETAPAQTARALLGDPVGADGDQLRSWMAVPLTLKDRVSGLVTFAAREPRAFTARQAALALAIANQAALAIENARLYEQAQELAAVEERQRLARELHDSVSQALYGIALGVHAAQLALERAPGEVSEALDYVLPLAEGALAEMRALIFELRPESLEQEGLVAALTRQAAALQARRQVGVTTELGEEPELSLRAKQELYRIAQEALHNTVKHAHAHQVVLRLEQTQAGVTLEVRDDGAGFDPHASFPGHLGLQSMRERITPLGGTLEIASTPGAGTRIGVWIPGRT